MKTRLQEFRKSAGFKSAKSFAEHIGMSVGTYTNYEQGTRSMDVETLWWFADFFNCSVDDLIGRNPPAPDMSDPVHKAIADAYANMNAHGRTRLAEEAAMMDESGRFAKSENHRDL